MTSTVFPGQANAIMPARIDRMPPIRYSQRQLSALPAVMI
jgi:hypothetical protein